MKILNAGLVDNNNKMQISDGFARYCARQLCVLIPTAKAQNTFDLIGLHLGTSQVSVLCTDNGISTDLKFNTQY